MQNKKHRKGKVNVNGVLGGLVFEPNLKVKSEIINTGILERRFPLYKVTEYKIVLWFLMDGWTIGTYLELVGKARSFIYG